MSLKRTLWLVLIALVFASSSMADGVPPTVIFNGGYAFANGGYGIPPYQGTLNGVPTNFFCVDFSHDISAGQTWTVIVTSLTDATGIENSTLLGSQTDYLEFAWLIGQLMSAENAKDWSDAAAYQWDIWSFTDGHPSNILATDPYPSWFAGQGWEILTPAVSGSGQEFMVQTPEPSTFLLLGAGLLLVGLTLKKRSARIRA